ncbi:Hypothetical predicted protein [Mytilus galloprovincialis]|uniref:Uncharacterized protein n=1 Tax=Mytilus galloprovincialis TaxID=29158 RepID=A0A8B6G990_MYTGA|nr:Hypothetical predicted protein [Mytilus galloprovincialis]
MTNSGEPLLSVHQFIKQLKDDGNGNLKHYRHFQEISRNELTTDIAGIPIPNSESPIQKFIHGDIFEYAVQQAAGHTSQKDDPWKKFKELYPNIKPKEKKQYSLFMEKAGDAAWEILNTNVKKLYGRKSKTTTYSFGHHIKNYDIFPFLTKKLEADVFVTSSPSVVCDIKYSTMKKEKYEEDYLVHAVIQVLIYSLALDLDPLTLQLMVLVFYSKTAEAVLYKSDIHKQEHLVNDILKKLTRNKATRNQTQPRKTGPKKETTAPDEAKTVYKKTTAPGEVKTVYKKMTYPDEVKTVYRKITTKRVKIYTDDNENGEEFTDDDEIIDGLTSVHVGFQNVKTLIVPVFVAIIAVLIVIIITKSID